MKWKVELIGVTAIIGQMAFLFYAWQSLWLAKAGSEIPIVLIILAIGIIGGLFMWLQKPIQKEENKRALNIIRWAGAIITAIAVYLVLVPVMVLLFHSKTTALVLIVGFLAPLFIYKLPALKGVKNA